MTVKVKTLDNILFPLDRIKKCVLTAFFRRSDDESVFCYVRD